MASTLSDTSSTRVTLHDHAAKSCYAVRMTDEQRVELWREFAETREATPKVVAKPEIFLFEPPKRPVPAQKKRKLPKSR